MTRFAHPEFERPPVVEVVCGVLFRDIPGMLVAHLGSLWDKFRADYPTCREVAPLAPVVEQFDRPPELSFQFAEVPPMARTWFVHKNETGIVQVQRDRFLHNWRKVRETDEYPRYTSVIALFKDRLAVFEAFLNEHGLGDVVPLQYELTYVNHMPKGEGWSSLGDTGGLFPDFAWRVAPERFLQEAEAINWRTSFALPNRSGRLHATIRNATRTEDRTPLMQIELTARGIPSDASRDAMWNWFDLAHEWIVCGFVDLTGERARNMVWRQTR